MSGATGALSYGLGFIAYFPIPFIGLFAAGIVMAAVYPASKRKGPLAEANSRSAANWGLTVLTIFVVLAIALIVLAKAFTGQTGFFPIGIPVVVYLALAITHVVVLIVGLVTTNKRTVFTNPIAIPYLRAPKN